MRRWTSLLALSMAVTVVLTACAPAGPGPARDESGVGVQRSAAKKSITAAVIPTRERLQVLAQILRYHTDVVTVMGLFYAAEPALISSRLRNAAARKVQESTTAWNAHEWELR